MKIMGSTYHHGTQVCVLKGDSALLVNRKPFFIPDCTNRPIAYPALALRVSRLGKMVAERFADRYFDAVALALDIQAADMLEQACAAGNPWTTAISMDGSFPVGEWENCEEVSDGKRWKMAFGDLQWEATADQMAEAICKASRYMTIRQGDIVYFPLTDQPIPLQPNDTIVAQFEDKDKQNLFCRIK